MKARLAFDLGAESGRAMLGLIDDGHLELHEVYRFANRPHRLPDGLHWNILDIWEHLQIGLDGAWAECHKNGHELVSLGVDTWGVDFGLVGRSGQLLGMPFCYRDERNLPAMEETVKRVGARRLYEETGLQLLPFNTLFQLVAQKAVEPSVIDSAARLAFIPDLLHYFFSGNLVTDATIASTSQMVDPRASATGRWANGLLADVGLPSHLLGQIVPPGMEVGIVRGDLAARHFNPNMKVIAPATHDTASAVAAAPSSTQNWCYISSGTWSLVGAELDAPLINEAGRDANFTNERGIDGKIRFLRNTAGLWLVQQVRLSLCGMQKEYDYAELTRMAAAARPFATLVDPAYGPFLQPGEMNRKITDFALKTGQSVPADAGALVRCCLESLALEYRRTILTLERLLGRTIDVVHIIGGGGRNELLDQMTAGATGKTVIVGPYEATAAGNVLVQAAGDGAIKMSDIRPIVRRSFGLKTFEPRQPAMWDEPFERYIKLLQQW